MCFKIYSYIFNYSTLLFMYETVFESRWTVTKFKISRKCLTKVLTRYDFKFI